ncbi:MAG: tetratricopeptide repeat protein, partial [Acidobacteriota bacterium]
LEHETLPARRCALLYRLAVTLGRRKKLLEPAFEVATTAIARSDELSPVESTYQEAWARNIRAYLLMLMKRVDDAVVDAETSFSLIERYSPETHAPQTPEERLWSRDFLLSQGVLISNLASLAGVLGSEAQHAKWNLRGANLAVGDSNFDRFRASDWISLYRRNAQLAQALPWAVKGAEICRREQETIWEYHFMLQASDLTYRLGDADAAFRLCRDMQALRARLGNPIGLKETELLSVNAAVRSGRRALAREILEARLDAVEYPDHRSQIAAHLGVLAALSGNGGEADRYLDQAIESAVSTGQRHSLLRVAAAAGRACRLLGREDEAEAAYRRALAIADAADPSKSMASDLLEVLLGLQSEEAVDVDLLLRALLLLPAALGTDEAW